MLKLRAVPLLLALTIGACHDGPAELRTARVHVFKVSDGIRVENLTDEGVGYLVIDQGALALVDWSPCRTTTPDCLRLPAHGAVTVKFANIAGYSTSTKSVVAYTWSVVDNGNGGVVANLDTPAILKID
jgi:hypothetical protein